MKTAFSLLITVLTVFGLTAQNTTHRCHHFNTRAWTQDDLVQAANERSDTIDVLNYNIRLDITNLTGQSIDGNTVITFTPLMSNVTEINLDLLELTVDSVKQGTTVLTWTYNDTLLKVTLPVAMNPGDTNSVTVWYHGNPQGDASGWGGFYFQSGYAYNLGVGFAADPHNYGRVWHPCFDNFVERATYTQTIGTNSGRTSYCNGMMTTDTTDGNGVRWRTWEMTSEIPTYLACVAVSGYTHVNWTFNGVNGSVPAYLTALPADTTAFKNSFINLPSCFNAFESLFYPYMWQRVGFTLVPFSSGAMEHATAISYPRVAANGSLTYETLMAHEFAHHWFGDLATCRTQEDMWLNEGWASYCEYIFLEWQYGRTPYDNGIRDNHDEAVHFFHHREGGYRAISGVPHSLTYGDHVYLKGADVAHTLRGYMGDSLFFSGIRYHFSQSEFTDVSSADFRDNLIASTGLTYLTDFFDNWVFAGGWPHFAVDSMTSVPNGPNYDVTLYVQQKRVGAPNYYTNVPLEFAFYKTDGTYTSQRLFVSNQYSTHTVTLPYDPTLVVIDPKNLISDAETPEEKLITATGTSNFSAARCTLTVQNCPDTAWVRIEHHWAAPDPIQNNTNNYNISDLRYWKLTGLWPSGFVTRGRFNYDGRTTGLSGTGFYLDHDLTIPNGDSIILLYREDAAHDWREWPYYTKTVSGAAATSKFGYVIADSLQPGEYTFANGVSTVLIGTGSEPELQNQIGIYPVPATDILNIELPQNMTENYSATISDAQGKIVIQQNVRNGVNTIDVSALPDGIYFCTVTGRQGIISENKFTVIRN
ncbi:MAG: T9SS type A sorting domain-containing protein [Bacteroidia bacterium]|nr:T9SS type A sorting domain-containing protein [Bacteroidia bacterium]